ncbi:MAG: dipeptidase [Acidipropionibacterium sp.]|jgi:membrane dipeptidase|nr:dipeptidase [Acidipropionibacterium sp.]
MGRNGRFEDSIHSLRAGGVNCIGMTLSAEEHDTKSAMDQIKFWNKAILDNSTELVNVRSADEIRQAHSDGRIAIYYMFQNGKPFADDPGNVELFRDMGVISSAVTYNHRNFLGDGCMEPENSGISMTGKAMIREMNRVGMLVDLSHAGKRTQYTAAEYSVSPPYFSHNNCYSVIPNRRNAEDETMRIVAEKGGNMNAMPLELGETDHPTVADMVDHVMHMIEIMGPEHVGFAMDYPKGRSSVYETAFIDDDGFLNIQYDGTLHVKHLDWSGGGVLRRPPWYLYAEGVDTYIGLPNLTLEMVARGLDDTVISGVLGGNFLSLLERVVG